MSTMQFQAEVFPSSLRELLGLARVQDVVFGSIRRQLESFELGRRSQRAIDEDARELLQDVMLRALTKESTFRPEDGGVGWLLMMAHRLVCTRCRRLRRKERCGDGLFDLIADLIPTPTIEDRSWVWEVVDGLPSTYSEVLRLRYDCEMTPASIAASLGLADVRTVSDRLYRAKALFREAVMTTRPEGIEVRGLKLM
ncbi:MAG: hypothetical protein BGO49_30910 [Planctomycetales bacterium 71-10]|nr:MAG: hypothetical protein BGO49_30910 [Planctomycetales bacterium 71-10]